MIMLCLVLGLLNSQAAQRDTHSKPKGNSTFFFFEKKPKGNSDLCFLSAIKFKSLLSLGSTFNRLDFQIFPLLTHLI